MGTYTTNYQLYMPTIGEQGWGELINGNYQTIDTTMAGLNTRTGTLETEMDAVEGRITVLEAGNFETVTVAGSITADELCGKRVGVVSTTQPTKWSPAVGLDVSVNLSFIHNKGSGSSTYSPDVSKFYWWDDIETNDLMATYTVSMPTGSGVSPWYGMKTAVVTITDYSTGNSVTKTFTRNSSTAASWTMIAPRFATIQIDGTTNYANGTANSVVTVTRDDINIYIKPKGT